MHHLRGDPAPFAAFEPNQPVALHCPKGAREVGLGLPGDPRKLVERAGRLRGDYTKQLAVAGRQHLGKRLRGGEPDLRLVRCNVAFAPGHSHRASLHLLIAGNARFQCRHPMTPLSRNTASTAVQKSASKVAASWYSYSLMDRSRCR